MFKLYSYHAHNYTYLVVIYSPHNFAVTLKSIPSLLHFTGILPKASTFSASHDEIQTKHGRALLHILGRTNEVKRFDRARKLLKNSPRNEYLQKQYFEISAVMETRISRAESKIKEELKSWEKQHLRLTGDVSTATDMLGNPHAKMLLDKLKYCKSLAIEWQKEKIRR